MAKIFTRKTIVLIILLLAGNAGFSQVIPTDEPTVKKSSPTTVTPKTRSHHVSRKLPDTLTLQDDSIGEVKVSMKSIKEQAVRKTKELTDYISSITDKNTTSDEADKNIDQACKLFANEDASVEVSNYLTHLKHRYKIREYLKRLKISFNHYDSVVIKYADIVYVAKFRRGVGGNYYSVVSFVQRFEGFIDNKLVFGDVTRKDVTVVVKPYTKEVDGESTNNVEIFLSDISVKETRKIQIGQGN